MIPHQIIHYFRKVSPCGEFLFVRTKRNQKCAGERRVPRTASLRCYFSDPISFDSAKRNGIGPPKKSADRPFGATHSSTGAVVTRTLSAPCAAAADTDRGGTLCGPRQSAWLAQRGPRRSPAKRVRWGEEEQGSERNFHRQAEMKLSGLCDDEVAGVPRGPGGVPRSPVERRAEISGCEWRLTSAPEIGVCTTLFCSPVKMGDRGCRRLERKRVLGA